MVLMKLKKYLNIRHAIGDQLKQRSSLRALPLSFHFEVNDNCNLKCAMCARQSDYVPKGTGNLEPSIIRGIRKWLARAQYVGLAGNGEPFLHPRLFDILEDIRQAGSVPSLITNGMLLTLERLERLIALGPSILNISIDAATKSTFESIRVGANFDTILHNLDNLVSLKKIKKTPFPIINFLACVMENNKAELMGIIYLAARFGVPKVIFQTVFPFTDYGRENMLSDLDEINQAVGPAKKRASELGIEAVIAPLFFSLEKRLEHQGKTLRPGTHLFCENIWQTMHVGINGDVRFCCYWTGKSIGNLAERRVPEIWNHPEFVNLRAAICRGGIPTDCRNCHVLEIYNPEEIRSRLQARLRNL